MDHCILDLATLRYQWSASRSVLTALSPQREVLAAVSVPPGTSEREAAFLATDAALDKARLYRVVPMGRKRLRLALYNPFTAEVSLRSTPNTQVYSDHTPLVIPPAGLVAALEEDALLAAEHTLARVEPSFSSLSRAYQAHRALSA